jgi:hypothetical protein
MRLLDERAQRNTDTLKEIRDELRRQRETFDVWAFEQRKSKR